VKQKIRVRGGKGEDLSYKRERNRDSFFLLEREREKKEYVMLLQVLAEKDTSEWLPRDWVAVWAYHTFLEVSDETGDWPSKRERHELRERLLTALEGSCNGGKQAMLNAAKQTSDAWYHAFVST